MKIQKIDLNQIKGFKIGNAENTDKGTGCTVIICEQGAVGGVDVRGGAPATRETDLLKSENTVNKVHAVVLSGGSAFGLEASSAVMHELSERGIGYNIGFGSVPIVCGASLFDRNIADYKAYPDLEMGREAVRNAYEGIFEHGNKGAGTGATVGKIHGMGRAMKSGLGTFACADDILEVGAVVAVNAMGDIYNGAGNIIAGLRTEDGSKIYGTIKALKSMVYQIKDDKSDIPKVPDFAPSTGSDTIRSKSEIADAIKNAFNNKLKNAAMTTPEETAEIHAEAPVEIPEEAPTEIIEEAPVETVVQQEPEASFEYAYENVSQQPQEIIEEKTETIFEEQAQEAVEDISEAHVEEHVQEIIEEQPAEEPISTDSRADLDVDEDQGYGISFNTTIGCLITNAKLSKPQANKLASILHDAYARAIKPVHSSMDGDTIFVLTTGTQEVNFDAFAALATDVMQYAIIDAAMSAETAYGLPAACDIIR